MNFVKKSLIFVMISLAGVSANAYNFLFTAHDKGVVAIANNKGKIFWSIDANHPQRADMSEDGKFVFISELNGARMVEVATKKNVWTYTCPEIVWNGADSGKIKKGGKVQCQNPVAQILDKDRFLVGNEGKSMLLEIDSKGKTLKEIKTESLNPAFHGEFRLASKTKQGTYLIPLLGSSLLTEYDAAGKQILRVKTPSGVVGAERMSDGNTIVGGLFGLAIYDKDGKQVWEMSSKALQNATGAKEAIVICDVKTMPNGNFLCTTYAGKDMPDVIEVSRDKKVVRAVDFPKYTAMSAIQLLDDNLKPIK